jgi:peptidoglycan/xylan/chitin deacetylase (PgdA/CDA1 family)
VFIVLAVVLVAIAGLAHTAPAPFLLEAYRPRQSIWRVRPAQGRPPAIYLTFDDGPNATWTPVLLDALREVEARGTFFLIDAHLSPETAPIVRRIADEGHAIALHSGSRRPMLMAPDALAAHLRRASDRIAAITSRRPCAMFRPHAGWRSSSMYDGLRQAGVTLVGWSWGMWDWHWWQRPDGATVAARLAGKASAGDIVVIHDGHHADPDADRRHAAETVRRLVPSLRDRGFAFEPLCRMEMLPAPID